MRFFLAGIMQGSHRDAAMHGQDYRARLKTAIAAQFPGAEIYDPLADHGQSLGYDDAQARRVFMHHNQMCAEIDVLVAFVPEASMGTAVEMWQAYIHGRVVLTISPLAMNWAIKYLSHAVWPDLESFEQALASGAVGRTIEGTVKRG